MPKNLFNLWAFVGSSFFLGGVIYIVVVLIAKAIGFDLEPYWYWIMGLGTLVSSYVLQFADWQ